MVLVAFIHEALVCLCLNMLPVGPIAMLARQQCLRRSNGTGSGRFVGFMQPQAFVEFVHIHLSL